METGEYGSQDGDVGFTGGMAIVDSWLDPVLGEQLAASLFNDVLNADEIRLEKWRGRNPLLRIVQVVSRALDQQS